MDDESLLVDQKNLAQMLGVKPKTVSRLAARGEIPKPKIGGPGSRKKYWLRSTIEAWAEKNTIPSETISGQ